MTMILRAVLLAISGLSMAACSAPQGEPTWWGYDTEYYGVPYFNLLAYEFATDAVATDALSVASDVPASGTAHYTGAVGADYTGIYDGSIVAQVELDVDFASGDIDGFVGEVVVGDVTHNIAYSTPHSFVFEGTQAAAALNATMTGDFLINRNTNKPGGDETTMSIDWSLTGDFRDGTGASAPAAFHGTGSGNLTGEDGSATADIAFFGQLD